MADVFISYKSERRAAAEHLAEILADYGYTVWWDYGLLSGSDFGAQIERELRAAKAVVVLWCAKSIHSKWVKEEAGLAEELAILVPAKIEATELPLGFRRAQTLDLIAWDGSPRSANLDKLFSEIVRLTGKGPVPNQDGLARTERAWRRFGAPPLAKFALIDDLERTRPARTLPSAVSGGGEVVVASTPHADLHDAWKRFSLKNDVSAVEKFLSRVEKAGVHDLAVEIETHLDRLKSDAAAKAEAERFRPGREFRDGDGPLMVVIPDGEFMMGSPPEEKERRDSEGPHHLVRIAKPFAVSKYPITVGEWKSFIAATGHFMGDSAWAYDGKDWKDTNGRGWADPGFQQNDRHPVTCVNWQDAAAYAAWLAKKTGHTYRLLSEAEWEYSCRAGTDTPFHFGRTITPDQANYDGNFTYDGGPKKGAYKKGTTPVGSYPANAFGLHDCHGNVWEWVQDCWNENYNGAPTDGTAWATGDCDRRVVRGGSWDFVPQLLRSATRFGDDRSNRNGNLGFRLARTL